MNSCLVYLKDFNKLFAQWLLEKINMEKCFRCEVWEENNTSVLLPNAESTILIIQQIQNKSEISKIQALLVAKKNVQVIVWWRGDHLCDEDIIRTINTGAAGLVSEKQDWNEIMKALDDVREHKFHHNEIITDALYHYCRRNRILHSHIESPARTLGVREKKIIELKRTGMTSREIGEILFLSKKTIDKVFGEMYRKFDCNNFFELLNIYEGGYSQKSS